MASGPLVEVVAVGGSGAEESRDRSDHRFPLENKVYTRKSFKKNHKLHSSSLNPPSLLSSPAEDPDSTQCQQDPQPPLPPANSDDASSSLNRPATPQPDDCPAPSSLVVNGHDRRRITFNLESLSRQERLDLRRKLALELEQVRAFSKRLDSPDLQLAGVVAARDVLPPTAVYTMSQVSATDPYTPIAGKMAPEAATPTTGAPNPFRSQLTVYTATNDINVNDGFDEKRTRIANRQYRNTDFVLGNEKLPPPEYQGHKKTKANGENKQLLNWWNRMNDHTDQKKLYAQVFKDCTSLLAKLLKHRFAWVFNKPVDVEGLGLHDYYTIIRHPMDLGTIKARLSKNWYKSPLEFAEDVRLTFLNAMIYNPDGQDAHIMAKEMLKIFEEKWPAIEAKLAYISHTQDAKMPLPLDIRMLERSESTMHPTVSGSKLRTVSHPSHVGRLLAHKKPKAKDLNKRDMTLEEKQKLSNNLQNLPQEKLELVVQIIKNRNLSMSQHDDELEIDIDSADAETLWELDRFVMNYKKSLSKHKRKAELAALAKQKAEEYAREMAQANETFLVEAPEKVMEDKHPASSLPVFRENKGGNASGSSSASSSSNDSKSSSSDSDSDNSSGNSSDAAHSPRA